LPAQTYAVPSASTDPQRRVTQTTDPNGSVTTYAYDANHLTSKTEASGTSTARTTSYQYLATTSALPTVITEALKTTSIAYYSGTNLPQTRTITDPATGKARSWNYTYDSYGRVLTAKGPRTDINSTITYAYYACTTGAQCGQLETATDPVGNITTYNTYNAFGQPLTVTDPNGVVTTLTYDSRQRLTSRQVASETTGFSYYPTGLLKQVTLPDSSYVVYLYDGAHRLTQIQDGLGNSMQYTLDAMGNRTAQKSFDPNGVLHRAHSRAINALNEVYQDTSAAGTAAVTTTYGYDNDGNVQTVSAPMARNTSNAYDALSRLTQVTDPATGITKIAYDANDRIVSVKDPRSLVTSYTNNGLGDHTAQTSPDTGAIGYSYDSAGNVATVTTARGAMTSYVYDPLNRPTQVSFTMGGTTDQTIALTYDTGGYGKGRLTNASDANQSVTFSYDALGRVVSKKQIVGPVTLTVGYGYTNGKLTTLTTPSGKTITYSYNANHQISGVSVNGTPVLSAATYEPFGAISGWTWGNGTTTLRSYNTDGNIANISSAATKDYTYDNALRITGIADGSNSNLSWTFGYDAADRLTSGATPLQSISFTYDANGNRLTQGGSATETLTPSSTSNILTSVSGGLSRTYAYDASGNTLGFSGNTFTYNHAGRISSVSNGTGATTYLYNAFGQRIQKSSASSTTNFVYDESGHLIGEYDGSGTLIQEIVWVNDTPVATVRIEACGLSIFYIHTDHLNTPRRITRRSTADVVWSWESDPFGNAGPNQNPSGLGTFVFNLRLPGQYYDSESGLNQNYFRDYDPSVGRYVESDPMGLKGGINTYGYVRGSAVMHGDFFGLLPGDCYLTQNAAGANAVNDINWQSIQSNTEYAGRVYENQDGTYSYTAPTPGTATTSEPGPLTPSTVGSYHTHGGKQSGYGSENFSPKDVEVSILEGMFIQGYVAYLGTPDGVIKAFDPHSYIGDPQNTSPPDMQIAQFWNLPYPTPGQAVPCACDER
jgi:RHS repeat-associated protein